MNRRDFIQQGLAATVATSIAAEAQPVVKTQRPNLLYIFSDQHRAVSMPGEPFNQALAPNLDAFRRQNVSMDRCISNYPLCTPYRGILMSGRWPQQTGLIENNIQLAPSPGALGTTFQQAGYHTGYIGKWHLSGRSEAFIPPGPYRFGFEDWHVWNKTNAHYNSYTFDPNTGRRIQPQGWNCTLMTDQAITFLEQQPRDKPWFLIVSWNPPHPPFNPPQSDANRYPTPSLTFRPNVHRSDVGPHPRGIARALASDEALRTAEQGYYGGITGVDLEFARILQTLEQTGQADNTIVIYTSDHGEMMGSQGRMAKQVPFEESCRVPFFIRYPGHTATGGASDALFSAIDILPTVCGLVGIAAPASAAGRDLSGTMLGRNVAPSDIVFLMNHVGGTPKAGAIDEQDTAEDGVGDDTYVNQPSYRGARTSTHTYAVMETGRWCLYDNVKDPYQLHNLVSDPAQQSLMKQLDAQIMPWLQGLNDPFPFQQAVRSISAFPA